MRPSHFDNFELNAFGRRAIFKSDGGRKNIWRTRTTDVNQVVYDGVLAGEGEEEG